MQDFIYVLLIVALTGVAALFVLACDKIVGSDAEALAKNEPAATRSAREEERVRAA